MVIQSELTQILSVVLECPYKALQLIHKSGVPIYAATNEFGSIRLKNVKGFEPYFLAQANVGTIELGRKRGCFKQSGLRRKVPIPRVPHGHIECGIDSSSLSR